MAATHAGRSTRRFKALAVTVRNQHRPCCICGQSIDYTLDPKHPASFTVEHLQPLSTHPHLAEDPANLDAAHRACNSQRGVNDTKPSLGTPTNNW